MQQGTLKTNIGNYSGPHSIGAFHFASPLFQRVVMSSMGPVKLRDPSACMSIIPFWHSYSRHACMIDSYVAAPRLLWSPLPPPAEHAFSSDLASQLGHLFVDVHVHALASFRAFLPVRAHENCNRTTSHPTARNIENTYAQPKIQPNPRTCA